MAYLGQFDFSWAKFSLNLRDCGIWGLIDQQDNTRQVWLHVLLTHKWVSFVSMYVCWGISKTLTSWNPEWYQVPGTANSVQILVIAAVRQLEENPPWQLVTTIVTWIPTTLVLISQSMQDSSRRAETAS